MVPITSPGDWILTGGKLIRCTVDRNITCLQEEERKEREEVAVKRRTTVRGRRKE